MQPSRFKDTHHSSHTENQDAWISDLDPILQGGYKVAYLEPKFAIEVRTVEEDGSEASYKELLQLRILTLQTQDSFSDLKIELSSEEDIFRIHLCHLDEKKFEKIQKNQHLNFGFQNLLGMLIKQVQLCQKSLNQFSAVLYLNRIASHRLDLLENIEYKRIELLSLQFRELDEEMIKNYVTFRFTKTKMNKQIMEKKLRDVMGITKLKNQNLWQQIAKKEGLRFSK